MPITSRSVVVVIIFVLGCRLGLTSCIILACVVCIAVTTAAEASTGVSLSRPPRVQLSSMLCLTVLMVENPASFPRSLSKSLAFLLANILIISLCSCSDFTYLSGKCTQNVFMVASIASFYFAFRWIDLTQFAFAYIYHICIYLQKQLLLFHVKMWRPFWLAGHYPHFLHVHNTPPEASDS